MLHKDVTPADVHPIMSWVVADPTALGALTPAVTDIGKVALQQTPFGLFVLEDDTGPVWTPLSATTSLAASAISVVDAGGFFVGVNVESILQEIGPKLIQVIEAACSDEVTNLTTGTNKIIFHSPYTMTVTEMFVGLSTAQSAGSIFTVDVNKNGVTMLSTKLTIDNTEKTSLTAATPAVISVAAVTKGDEISVDIDQVGTASAKGLKLYIRGVL